MQTAIKVFSLLLLAAAACSAQSIAVSKPTSDKNGIVTVEISYAVVAPEFTPKVCHWYSMRNGNSVLIHEGCDAFPREFAEGTFFLSLTTDGSTPTVDKRQYTDSIKLIVHPRVEVQHPPFPK
jgi:hypothetical protein